MSNIKTDYYPAGKNCLLILTGRGGDTKGYENKYEKIAGAVTRKYGFSVVVAAVPENCWERSTEAFKEAFGSVLPLHKDGDIYVMGSSAGASLAIWYAHLYPQIKRLLAVNPVLNLNFHRTRDGLEKFAGDKAFIICGELDPCVTWAQLLPEKDNLKKEILKDTDHVFSGRLSDFIALPERTLFT